MNTFAGKLLSPHYTEYLVVEPDLRIIETSLGVPQLVERPEEVIPGKDVRLGFPELIGAEDFLIDILQGREIVFELKSIARLSKNGSHIYIDLYIKTLDNRLIIFLEDVTSTMVLHQKLVQRGHEANLLLTAFAASHNYIDKIVRSMADALLVTTPSGTITTVNQSATDLFGYSQAELINKPISTIITDENFLQQAFQQNSNSQSEIFKDYSVACQSKTASKLTVAFSCSVIQTEIEGEENFVYIGRDITERKRIEQLQDVEHITTRILSESATLDEATPLILQAICSSLGWEVGELWSVDPQANVLRCVETWHAPSVNFLEFELLTKQTTFLPSIGLPGRIWASSQPEWVNDVVRDPAFTRTAGAARSGLHGAFGFPILSGREVKGVMTFFSHDIQEPQKDLLKMMADIGSQIGQFILRKIAEKEVVQRQQAEAEIRKILEAERELSELKSRMITTISHEYRTPLTIILGSCEILRQYSHKWSEEKKQKHFNRIQDAVEHMTMLVESALTVDKAEEGQLPYNPVSLPLEAFCRDLIQAQQLSSGSDYTFNFIYQGGYRTTANLDAQLVRHILTNLLSNAVKYSSRGGTVSLSVSCEDNQVIFCVQDFGIGIPLAEQQRLFETFFRASNVGNISGVGMGLAIVKKCVLQHGGQITVKSALGFGTTFTVNLPNDRDHQVEQFGSSTVRESAPK